MCVLSQTWGRPWSTCRCPWWCLGRRARCCSGSAPSCCTVGADQLIQNGRHQDIGRTERRRKKFLHCLDTYTFHTIGSLVELLIPIGPLFQLRYSFITSQVKEHYRYQQHRRKIFPPFSLVLLIPVANLPPVSMIPTANLPLVSTTPVANCH